MSLGLSIGGVFIASLLGSLHCALMCGPFAGLYAADSQKPLPHVLYHGMRLLAYGTLGALAGALGQGADLAGHAVGLQRLAPWLAIIAIAMSGLFFLRKRSTNSGEKPVALAFKQKRSLRQRLSIAASGWARGLGPNRRALGFGLITVLLPCGWLWSFVLVAAASGSPLQGGLTMIVFGLGSVPALGAVALGASGVFRSLAPKRYWLVPTLLVLAALGMTLHRGPILRSDDGKAPHCHAEVSP